jgi:hypothetical protein
VRPFSMQIKKSTWVPQVAVARILVSRAQPQCFSPKSEILAVDLSLKTNLVK